MYISGHQLVVDQLSALSANLGTATAGTFQTGVSGARTVMTSADYGGLISYDADDNYDPTLGTGSYQILLSKADGKLYAGGSNVVLDNTGLWFDAANTIASSLQWRTGGVTVGNIFSYVDSGTAYLLLNANPFGAYSAAQINLYAVDSAGTNRYCVTTIDKTTTTTTTVDAATNATTDVMRIGHNTTGTPATNFGSAMRWLLESSTTADQNAAQINVVWTTATHASRQAAMIFYAYDAGAAREFMRGSTNGSAPTIGFLGAGAVARQTVTGSRGGNAALASVLTALANLGLITDSSS